MLIRDLNFNCEFTNEYWIGARLYLADRTVLTIAKHSDIHPERVPNLWRMYTGEDELYARWRRDFTCEFEAQAMLDHLVQEHGLKNNPQLKLSGDP